MISARGRKRIEDRATVAMADAVREEVGQVAGTPAEAVVVPADRVEKAMKSGRRCTNC
jgi:hypothetical protein